MRLTRLCDPLRELLVCIDKDSKPGVSQAPHVVEGEEPLQRQYGGEYIGGVLSDSPVSVD